MGRMSDDIDEKVDAEIATRLIMDTLRTVNWFKLHRIGIKVHRNRKRNNRGQKILGTEYLTIVITTAPGGINKAADHLIGQWDHNALKRIRNALVSLKNQPVEKSDGD